MNRKVMQPPKPADSFTRGEAQEGIKAVIGGLFESLQQDNDNAFLEVKDFLCVKQALANAEKGEYEDFYFELLYPLSQLVDGLLNQVTDSHEARFLLKNSQFVERQFEKLIDKYEGMGCCADKSRTIIKSLLKFYMEDKEISFNYEQEYTYHLPQKIFKTHEEIIKFFDGVYRLYYGDPTKYLESLKDIVILGQKEG